MRPDLIEDHRRIDVHNHVIPQACLDRIDRAPAALEMALELRDGITWVRHRQGYTYPIEAEFADPASKAERLRRARFDGAIVSLAPPLFSYGLEADIAGPFLRVANEGIAAFCATDRMRYRGLASVPLQDVGTAANELEYAVRVLGLVGVEIGTNVNGVPLDDLRFQPFFEAVEALGVPVFVHPSYVGMRPGMEAFYFTNVIGNPLETAITGMRLIAGGILDRHPRLLMGLAHGGGFLPYQLGRLRHAATVRPELKHLQRSPFEYLPHFYFDSITHNARALRFLIEWAGAERVMLGSDFPFDMGDPDPVGAMREAVSAHPEWEQLIAAGNAIRIFGFPAPAVPATDQKEA